MNERDRRIIEQYRAEYENFCELNRIVAEKLNDIVKTSNILVSGIEHRVKAEKSLAGKLVRNDYYSNLTDLTDILGARIICFFADDVDKLGRIIEQQFTIDKENSSDKRAIIKADSFGYLSLHYICSLKESDGYKKELCEKRFEIQIRTILQHAWAAIEHDLGYKSEFGVPREVVREFARIAGLLEIADNEFVRARDHIADYAFNIKQKIANDDAENVYLDMISLTEYMNNNKKMRQFLLRIAKIEGSEIDESNPENYIPQLKFLGIDTIGQLQKLLASRGKTAYALAENALKGTELDIIASSVALRFLCQAELIMGDYTNKQILQFMSITNKDEVRAKRLAQRIIKLRQEEGEKK